MEKIYRTKIGKTIFGMSLLVLASSTMAKSLAPQMPQPPQLPPPIEQSVIEAPQPIEQDNQFLMNQRYKGNSYFLIKNKDVESSLPKGALEWLDVIKSNNLHLNCPQMNGNSSCSLISSVTLDSVNGEYKIVVSGANFIDGYVKLPELSKISSQHNQSKLWFKKVLMNGKESEIVPKNQELFVYAPKGDFQIEILLPKDHSKDLAAIRFDTSPLIFNNNIPKKQFIKEGNIVKQVVDIAENLENTILKEVSQKEQLDIAVFRKISMQIPNILTTKLRVIYSGQPKDFNLGKVLPEGFEFNLARSPLQIEKKEDGFWVKLVAGEHELMIESFLLNNVEKLNTQGLVSNSQNEIWSVEQANNIRQIEVVSGQQVNPAQASVPPEWINLPSYLVKESFNIKTNRRGIEENNNLNVKFNRKSYFGLNEDKMIHLDSMSINNYGVPLLTKTNSDLQIESFILNKQNQVLVEANEKQGVIIPKGNFQASSQSVSKNSEVNTQFWSGTGELNNWDVYLAPRMKMFAAFGDSIKTQNTWWDHWNLYTIFSVFIIVLAFYKLFGKTTAIMAFAGLMIFQSEVFSWQLWLTILFTLGLLKVLPDSTESRFAKIVSIVGGAAFILFSLYVFDFIRVETQLIINPSLEILINQITLMNRSSYVGHLVFLAIVLWIVFGLTKNKQKEEKPSKGLISKIVTVVFAIIGLGVLSSVLNLNFNNLRNNMPQNMEEYAMDSGMHDVATLNGVAPMEKAMRSMPMPAAAPIMMDSQSVTQEIQVNNFKQKELEEIVLKKSQVGSGVPNWGWASNKYTIRQEGTITEKSKVSFWIAPVWLVNLFSIFQMVFLLITLLVFGIGLMHLNNKKDWFEKLPSKIKNCKFIQKLLINDLQKGFLK